MNIQIFGHKKCSETKKAERFFKERNVPFQSINMLEKMMSKGEFQSISAAISPERLINTESKEFEKQNLRYMQYSVENKLMENPLLFKTPVVRNGKKATAGYDPETWKNWIEDERKGK